MYHVHTVMAITAEGSYGSTSVTVWWEHRHRQMQTEANG